VVCEHGEKGQYLPAGRGDGAAGPLCDPAGDLLASGATRAPLRRTVPGPAAVSARASAGDAGGHRVARVPPVGVVLRGPHATEPAVGSCQPAVRVGDLSALVLLREVLLDPPDEVVRRLVHVVRAPQGLLRRGLLQQAVEVVEDPLGAVATARDDVRRGDRVTPLRDCLEVVDRRPEVAVGRLGDRLQGSLLELDSLATADVPQGRHDGACGDVAELDLSDRVAQAAGHLVEVVGDEHERLTGTLDDVDHRPRAAAVGVAVEVVCFVEDHQPTTGLTLDGLGERGVPGGLAGDPFDDVGGALVAGVHLCHRPVHVVGERLGRGGLADAGRPVENDRFPVFVPRRGPLLEVVAGRVVAPDLLQRRRAVLCRPVCHRRRYARAPDSRFGPCHDWDKS